MILKCNECRHTFDADKRPVSCPFCGKKTSFTRISIVENGKELTHPEYIESLREFYLQNPPKGISREKIETMSASEIDDMDQLCE